MAEFKRRTITPESMEEEQQKPQYQYKNKFSEKNYLNVKLAKGENSK